MSGDGSRNGVARGSVATDTQGVARQGAGLSVGESGGPEPGARGPEVRPDPELRGEVRRRRFTAGYKARIVEEADRCPPGQLGALLRREGLYSSHLTLWRRQRAAGQLAARGGHKAGAAERQLRRELARVQREKAVLQRRLERAEIIIAVQKKLSTLLQVDLPRVEP